MPARNLNLDGLLKAARQNSKDDIQKAQHVRVSASRLAARPQGMLITTTTREPSGSGLGTRRHLQRITLPRGFNGRISDAPSIIVDCDCERWCFKWEYAMVQNGAAKLRRGNGAPAMVTNPANKPGLCKHLYVGLKRIYDREASGRRFTTKPKSK